MSIMEMKNVDVRAVDSETLVDVTKIVIDDSLLRDLKKCWKQRN